MDIVKSLGIPHKHNKSDKIEWDVKVDGNSGQESLAISHSLNEFTFHTDCSYEEFVPSHFALHAIKHDNKGGGINLLANGDMIIQRLSQKNYKVLKETTYLFKVPLEFYKKVDSIDVPIINENHNLRYRRNIIIEKNALMNK